MLLVGGNKAGKSKRWYRDSINEAERLYEVWLLSRRRRPWKVAAVDRDGTVEFARWEDVRAELAGLGTDEQLERAKRELQAYLHAYKLAAARKRRRLSQAQVATAMGVTQGVSAR